MKIADEIIYECSETEFLIRFSGGDPRQIQHRFAKALGTAVRAAIRSNAGETLSKEQLDELLELNRISISTASLNLLITTDKLRHLTDSEEERPLHLPLPTKAQIEIQTGEENAKTLTLTIRGEQTA